MCSTIRSCVLIILAAHKHYILNFSHWIINGNSCSNCTAFTMTNYTYSLCINFRLPFTRTFTAFSASCIRSLDVIFPHILLSIIEPFSPIPLLSYLRTTTILFPIDIGPFAKIIHYSSYQQGLLHVQGQHSRKRPFTNSRIS